MSIFPTKRPYTEPNIYENNATLRPVELTDFEIRLLADEYLFINKNCGEIEGYNQFARAVLRKAQEK